MPSNLRRWTGSQLGIVKPGKKTLRPRTNLREVAGSVRWARTRGGFEQRLAYERLMAAHVSLEKRRDLKTPAYLRLDAGERFPRIVVSPRSGDPASLFGPFRERKAAAAARDALHKLLRLRPCDYAFEPDPALPLGLGCVYAQVRTCAAPCLARVSEDAYRLLAREAVEQLAGPARRSAAFAEPLPDWVSAADSRALVVERWKDVLLLFPIRGGVVLDAQMRESSDTGLERTLAEISFDEQPGARDDTPWLVAWLRAPKRSGVYLVVEDGAKRSGSALANEVRSAYAAAARGSPAAS